MSNYAVSNGSSGQAVSSSYKSQIVVYASSGTQALRRGKVYDVLVGTNGVPADNYMQWDISRSTTTPTSGTATGINPLDTADSSAAALAIINLGSGEPTVTSSSSLFNVGVNQRASYRWVAAPGSELVYPATAANGLALRVLSGGYTGTAASAILLTEQ
jgi:hypothetical protein